MIAITFALPAESSGMADVIRKKKIAMKVELVHTGVGKKSCERKVEKFFRHAQPRIVISSGFAGGVREDLQPGDIILAQNFSDPTLLLAAKEALGDTARSVKCFTSTSIVDSMEERNRIARASGADAVDMETEVIARICATRAVPLLSLRVISDTAQSPLPAPPPVLFDVERQQTNGARLAAYFLMHPARIPNLIRFAKKITHAREILTEALVSVLRKLPG